MADVLSSGDWVAHLAEAFDTSRPSDEEMNDLLGLAGVSAHASERTAAPIACWLAARAGLSPHDALVLASELSTRLAARGEGESDAQASDARKNAGGGQGTGGSR